MLKDVLRSIILSQQEWLTFDETEIAREQLSNFKSLIPFGYVLTGVRRSGKSTLLKQMMRHHKSSNYFNFEDSRTAGFEVNDFRVVEELFNEISGTSQIMFFDEIQNVSGWERYVRDVIDRKSTVILTGSNAKLLSRELGTKLTGRHLDYEVLPFSYKEFLRYFKLKKCAESFSEYLSKGGFPEFLKSGNKEMLSTLVTDILFRDIFMRYNIRNQEVYKMITQFLLSNTGKEVSFNNLKNTFEVGSASSVREFLNYLVDAYLIFLLPRYSPSLKVQAKNPRKVYGIDQGLVNFSSVSNSPDFGLLLENTIFLAIRRKYREIWYFKGKRECDFIYRNEKNKLTAIQVSWELGLNNERREVEGLHEAMKTLDLDEGIIITYNQEDKIIKDDKKIVILPAWKWMD